MSDGLESANFIDLVILENFKHVFQAPAFSELSKGDEVVISGNVKAIVERVYTTRKNGVELDFILTASGTNLPLQKILKKVDYKNFKYKDEVSEYEERRFDTQT